MKLNTLLTEAWSLRNKGKYDDVRQILNTAEAICDKSSHKTLGRIYHIRMQVEADNENYDKALEYSLQSVEHYSKAGDESRIAHSKRHAAELMREIGSYDMALSLYEQILPFYRNHDPGSMDHANALRVYALLQEDLHNDSNAMNAWSEAKYIYEKYGIKEGVKEAREKIQSLQATLDKNKKMDNLKYIKVGIEINETVGKVWECWTSPDHIINWNAASEEWHTPSASNHIEAGGKFIYRMEAKDGSMGFDFEGTYDKVIPQKYIEYTLADGRNVRISFTFNGEATLVTEAFQPEDINSEELQQQGWQAILDNFKKYVENLK